MFVFFLIFVTVLLCWGRLLDLAVDRLGLLAGNKRPTTKTTGEPRELTDVLKIVSATNDLIKLLVGFELYLLWRKFSIFLQAIFG